MKDLKTLVTAVSTSPSFPQQKPGLRGRVSGWLDNDHRLGLLMVAPAILFLLGMVAYPFVVSVYLSLTDAKIGQADSSFVGFANYVKLWGRSVFRDKVIVNTLLYTVGAVPIKLALGLVLALALNRPFPLRGLVRGLILIPWVVPTSLSMVIFLWMFEPTFSVLNYMLVNGLGLEPVQWLAKQGTALFSVMMVNIWRGTPFFAVILLAALQGVPKEQEEAAKIDGATVLQRFRHITLPAIMPVVVVATLFSFIRTFAEMEIVWILTAGGPRNGTHMIGTYAYQQAIRSFRIGEGAAISLFFFPVMLLVVFLQLRYLQRKR